MAWTTVLDAIEDALDIEDLQPYDRGELARLHAVAGAHIAEPVLTIPAGWRVVGGGSVSTGAAVLSDVLATDADRQMRAAVMRGPGGIDELELDFEAYAPLVRASLLTVDDVELADREHRLAILRGIGPKRLAAIRAAVATHRERQAGDQRSTERA
jgi:hypothetical protein